MLIAVPEFAWARRARSIGREREERRRVAMGGSIEAGCGMGAGGWMMDQASVWYEQEKRVTS